MESREVSPQNLSAILIFATIALLLGYLYVNALSISYRAAILVHGGAVFVLGLGLFIRDLRAFLLFVVVFCIPLQFGYHVIHEPLADMESQPFSAGIAVDSVDVILILLYMHWIATAAYNRQRARFTLGGTLGAMLCIWIVYLFFQSSLAATRFRYSFFEICVLLKGFLLFLYLVNRLSDKRDLKIVVYALFAGAVAHGMYIWLQYATKLNYTLHGELVTYMGPEGFRSRGFFGSPDAAATLISLVFPVGLAYYLVIRDKRARGTALMCMLLVLVAIAFTQVRAAGLGIFVSSLVLLAITYGRGWIPASRIIKTVGALLLILMLASPFIVERFQFGTWGEDRVPLMETAWNMIKNNWLLGVGANNYPLEVQRYVPVNARHAWLYTVHNEYFLRLAETGIIGASLYFGFSLLMMVKLWRLCRSPDPWIYLVAAGFFAALVGSIPHRMLSFYHYVNVFMQICVMMALTQVLENLEKRRLMQGGSENPRLGYFGVTKEAVESK
ncbi:MAG TPA: O-antigen ligase family protein [Desulfomonilaceae bacterium]|nr:O-antigen ligase family protein [Desulfomonilaceae bacterium]